MLKAGALLAASLQQHIAGLTCLPQRARGFPDQRAESCLRYTDHFKEVFEVLEHSPGELSAFSRTARGPHAVAAATVGHRFGFAQAALQGLHRARDQALPSLAMAKFWGLKKYKYSHKEGNKVLSKCYLCVTPPNPFAWVKNGHLSILNFFFLVKNKSPLCIGSYLSPPSSRTIYMTVLLSAILGCFKTEDFPEGVLGGNMFLGSFNI